MLLFSFTVHSAPPSPKKVLCGRMEKKWDKCVKSNIIMQQNSDRSVREQEERNREQRERKRERQREKCELPSLPAFPINMVRLFSTERTIVEINR